MDQPIVGIRYVEAGPIAYCSPGDLALGLGDYVVVRTDQGERLGWVVVAADQVISATIEGPVRVIDRLASEDDVDAYRKQKRRAEEDIGRAQSVATRIDPRVRVASIDYNLAGDRAELTYTARENGDPGDRLRKQVAELLGVQLVSRQVGDRDRAKSLGGIGQCGRALCCATWMTEFPAISMKMAKDQGLAPNPSKISGVCGRLLCCLSFEIDAYREIVGTLPKVGKRVTTPLGRAKVLSINALTEIVRLRFDDSGEIVEMPAAQLRQQYGTAVRPEELEQEVEARIHEQDRERRENLLAAIEPVTERPAAPPAERNGADGSRESADPDRSRGRGRRDGDDAGRASSATARAGVRIERRRRPRPDAASSEAPEATGTNGSEPSPRDAGPEGRTDGRSDVSNNASGGSDARSDGSDRRRRRGRRGGRRRRGGGGS
jgi:cell fate regulator YaaT (PSP1 superfamily)